MSPLARTVANRMAEGGLGLAGGLAGLWIAVTCRGLESLALGSLYGSSAVGGRFEGSAALPVDAPWGLHAIHAFGPFLIPVALFLIAAGLASRLSGLAALCSAWTALWLAVPLAAELARYGWGRRGSLELLMQSAGLPTGGSLLKSALAASAGLAILAALRTGFRRTRLLPVTALAIPLAALYFLVPEARFENRWLERVGLLHLPLYSAGIVALVASMPRDAPKSPSRKAAVCLGLAGLLAVIVPPPIDNDARTVARTNWTEVSSDFWQVRFETDRFSTEERWQWLVDAGSRLGTYRERLGIELEDGPIRVRVARSEHAMREIAGGRGSAESFVLESLDEPVVMAGSNSQPEDLRSEPLLLMRRAWGQPSSTAMAFALARFALGSFDGDPLLTAAVRVACEESRFEPETVFALDGEYRSPLVRDVLGGAWVESAVARHGTGILPALYSEPVVDSLALCIDCLPACDPSLAHARPLRQRPGYLKGISFSHEVGTGAGYGTAAAVRELGRIADLGANAVAIVPYAFTAAPDEASIRFRTLETDARLLRTVRQARAAGLEIMLKPHLWAGRRFHGSIAFDSEERFDEWFDDYRRWMLHFARFAEMYELDALAVGNELAGLTVHEEDWRSLIAEVRRVYRGPLTYAAHWEEELERIRFWDELDWIGVNFYFPLAANARALSTESAEISLAARKIAGIQSRYAKPILFTEVGFPALATAAARPWEENSSALNPKLQARCYSVWLERFACQSGVEGMFWWKWPSHGRGSPFDPSHSPLGKPALGVLKNWYERL